MVRVCRKYSLGADCRTSIGNFEGERVREEKGKGKAEKKKDVKGKRKGEMMRKGKREVKKE